jgi:hypothetical protein
MEIGRILHLVPPLMSIFFPDSLVLSKIVTLDPFFAAKIALIVFDQI